MIIAVIPNVFIKNAFITVNGVWGEFAEWTECPVSCGGGERSRVRTCDSPAPAHGGNDCTVDGSSNTEVERCNENPCPGIAIQEKARPLKVYYLL